ncbi:MAG: hypothetical protein HKO59_01130 [Phycisphaerales bacterium]|nr:hypothetical protein [Phycisphaerales bacterium]
MTRPAYRDLVAERRAQAAACVDRHVAELRALLDARDVPCRIVEGSAAAAEVYLSDTNTLHTAVRVAMYAEPRARDAIDAALQSASFRVADPAGDMTLLRLAAARGRRAIHVLVDGDTPEPAGRPIHPGDEQATRMRAERIGSAWLPLAATYRRVRDAPGAERDVTESFEVHVIEHAPTAERRREDVVDRHQSASTK